MDAFQIKHIPEEAYEYIIVAITDHSVIESTLILLEGMEINKSKILYVQKEDLVIENLPIEVQAMIKWLVCLEQSIHGYNRYLEEATIWNG